ncbi:hypothetical protein J3459_007594 [Metarhizium acridum]|uniref:uncharacterized protein n=1 Tax=Metarhizium acridum TaxID=92637 RepID=UPI001C6C7BA6|nr:hypothetical protein J3458_007211 [Metarhizium acridum]KAG8427011.1 hypothetical protein J3459_007594 [Metarhizium acridum]
MEVSHEDSKTWDEGICLSPCWSRRHAATRHQCDRQGASVVAPRVSAAPASHQQERAVQSRNGALEGSNHLEPQRDRGGLGRVTHDTSPRFPPSKCIHKTLQVGSLFFGQGPPTHDS